MKTSASILENGGDAWVEALKSEDYAVAVEKLMSLAGIGRKVADCIALYGVREKSRKFYKTLMQLLKFKSGHYFLAFRARYRLN